MMQQIKPVTGKGRQSEPTCAWMKAQPIGKKQIPQHRPHGVKSYPKWQVERAAPN